MFDVLPGLMYYQVHKSARMQSSATVAAELALWITGHL